MPDRSKISTHSENFKLYTIAYKFLKLLGLEKFAIRSISNIFLTLVSRHTDSFMHLTWLGKPIWQPPLDLWTIQETIYEVRPELLIECGTNLGGSAYFYAQLFDAMDRGRVLTIDINDIHKDQGVNHPRIEFITGSSVSDRITDIVEKAVSSIQGPIMVILDSDHSEPHVRKELEIYTRFVTPGSYVLVQDSVADTLSIYKDARPGPLPAIKDFLKQHPEFEVDEEKCSRFLITYHPMGWLKRLE